MNYQKFVIGLTLVPAIWLAILINHFTVNSFHADQWVDTLPLMANALNHQSITVDLMHQNGEHRTIIPKLISLALAPFTHWSILTETWLMFLLAMFTLVLIWRLQLATQADPWIIPIISMMLFTPAGYSNWSNSYQTCIWIPMACFAGAMLASLRYEISTMCCCCMIATWSMAAGFALWPVVITLEWIHNRDRNYGVGLIFICAMTNIGFYFLHYHHEPNPAAMNPHYLLDAGLYFVGYFGLPFCNGLPWQEHLIASVVGAGLISIFAGIAWNRRHESVATPWIGLGSIGILLALMTTAGRAGGAHDGLQRYIPFASLLTIAIFGLIHHRVFLAGLVGVLVTLSIIGGLVSIPEWRAGQHFLEFNQAATQLVNIIDETNRLQDYTVVTLPNPAETIGQIKTVDRHGWMHPGLIGPDIRRISDATVHQECGEARLGTVQDGRFAMQGTGQLADRQADAILFTQDFRIFDFAVIGPGQKMWEIIFGRSELHERPLAWAYDAKTERAYLLKQ